MERIDFCDENDMSLLKEYYDEDMWSNENFEAIRQEKLRLRKLARRKHPPYILEPKEDEVYKTVIENPNYEVSNYGNIRNKKSGENLKATLTNYGYRRVILRSESGDPKAYFVHRLEAHAFMEDGYSEDLTVNHKDGNKVNNYISNLEWCTNKENIRHAFRTGLIHFTEETSRKHREAFRKIYPAVRCVENGRVYPDARVAADDLNLDQCSIRQVTRGCYNTHGGYHFENADQSEVNFFGQ